MIFIKSDDISLFPNVAETVNRNFLTPITQFAHHTYLRIMSPSSNNGSAIHAMLSGTIAGSVSTFAGAPFDYVKVRMQTNQNTQVTGLLVETIRNPANLATFFRGTSPALICAVLENSVVFGANAVLKRLWRKLSEKDSESLVETAFLGGASGVFSATAISPAETVKIRLQSHSYISATDCLKGIIKEEGALALFRGLPAQLPRDVLFNFVFFSSFDAFCLGTASVRGIGKEELSVFDLIASGGLAGAAGWTFTIPFDVVKSRTQGTKLIGSQEGSLNLALRTTKDIFRESGLKGFFRGWGAATVRAFPVNGVLFACYSLTERALNRFEN